MGGYTSIVFISIIVIYTLAIIYNLLFVRPKICPICAGVSGTWLWMLITYFIRPDLIQPLWLGILMGGSIIGIMYQIDKRLAGAMAWIIVKPLWVATGFGVVVALLLYEWSWLSLGLVILAVLGIMIVMTLLSPQNNSSKILEKLKNCC